MCLLDVPVSSCGFLSSYHPELGRHLVERLFSLSVLLAFIVREAVTGLPGWLNRKESACNSGDSGSIPELGRFSGGGHGNPLQYSALENPYGQRSLAGYSPWGCKELNTTE